MFSRNPRLMGAFQSMVLTPMFKDFLKNFASTSREPSGTLSQVPVPAGFVTNAFCCPKAPARHRGRWESR